MRPVSHPAAVPPATATHFRVLRTVPNYTEARQVVDALSDARFPVEHVRVVGTGLRLVEQITGRMTYGRAAVLGAGTGAWLGLFLGLLLGILTLIGWWPVLMWTLVLGVIWGLVLGLVAHAATGGRRDFSSVQGLEADAYDVLVDADHFDAATTTLNSKGPNP